MHQLELPGLAREGTLHEALTWLLEHGLECSYWTRRMHADNARYLELYFGGDRHVRTIKYQDLKAYYEAEQRRGLSRESIRKRLSTLKMALDECIRRELLEKLPPWVVIKTDSRPKDAYWTLAEWRQAHAACDDEDLRTWIACGFWTGMHSSDLNRFRWSDVDLFKKTWVRRCTKSKAEPRTLPMPDELHAVLLERFGRLQPHPRDLVAARNMGNPNRVLKELCERAGVPRISPIGLRHSCETHLEEVGETEQFQVTWMGHKSARMIKKVYRHTTPTMLDRGIAQLNAVR